jgi:hypothetical protein
MAVCDAKGLSLAIKQIVAIEGELYCNSYLLGFQLCPGVIGAELASVICHE